MSGNRLIAVGDVHGCVHALDTLLGAIAPEPSDTIVFLGDLIDQGYESREVLERILKLQNECQVVLIEGNHEAMLFAARDNLKAQRYWENCGGATTISSYRVGGTLHDIPRAHWQLLSSARPYYETDEFVFTHAGYQTDLPMSEQPDYQLRWAILELEKMHPHLSGKQVFLGHTEQRSGEILDVGFLFCIDTACWRSGWLTAIDVDSKQIWQASRWGMMRGVGESSHRDELYALMSAARERVEAV
jgi:calcineurin-like phosphoesterase family protein